MKKIKIILYLFIIIVLLILIYTNFIGPTNNTIVATKTIIENDQSTTIKYTVKIKDYDVGSIRKVITSSSKKAATNAYEMYETINSCENKGFELELKGKKLIITMPEKTFKEDIQYNVQRDMTLITKDGEQKKVIDIEAVKEALENQGYTIK